ncbi:hypothetical protein BTHERMOSOX_1623 [Bathymodiolus thermophilus thioautotrophic gill symbiont]|uniref:hypothetical protein n=1 Tax=Bathymodiolus thermophilus thioautotrophic gill symbiont TaxID=2360 RepID=UPI0010BAA029|nr:hypothetical protein [Bathymodiolus thermophilus thioautotrophic gill symbiont]SHA19705.1 hypothetical protein BTHERMOSOX_1623 [Bathymodiolus thermophilus thioautotrophic gill symbiont]
MDDKEQVVKHLEITQGVVNRLAGNSFSIKGWSMAILAQLSCLLPEVTGNIQSTLF